jgi:uncharacterized protein (UPF0332 family)
VKVEHEAFGGVQAFVDHLLQMYIVPEVEQRKQDGRLPRDFVIEKDLRAGQAILNPEDEWRVRLNDEVKFRVIDDISYGVTDGIVDRTDGHKTERLDVTEEDANASHVTLVRRHGAWYFIVGPNQNGQRIRRYIDTAKEFLEAATSAHERKHARAFVDNLYSTVETLGKALLLPYADSLNIVRSVRHGFSAAQLNKARRDGRIPDHFAEVLNWLTKNRVRARYNLDTFTVEVDQARAMLTTAREMVRAADFEALRRGC